MSDRRPCRVLNIEGNEDGTVGGSHQALFDLVTNIDRSRFEPVVLFYQDNRFAEMTRDLGVEVHLWDDVRDEEIGRFTTSGPVGKVLQMIRSIRTRRAFLRKHRIDLVHMNNTPRGARDDWLPAARLVGVPIVAGAMGDAEPLPSRGARSAVQRWLTARFDLVLPVSEYIRAAWERQGVPPQRLRTINHGVDVEGIRARVSRTREAVREEFGVAEGQLLVAMVGNIRRWKGQHVVVDALRRMPKEDFEAMVVVFVGAVRPDDEEYFKEVQASVEEFGLKDQIRFVGMRTDVPDILSAADIAIHSSVTPEPGGIVVLEAMALCTAVVAADRGGHVEYLLPDFGLVHDVEDPSTLADHLVRLVRDPEARRGYAERAGARAQEYSMRRNAQETEAAYETVLG